MKYVKFFKKKDCPNCPPAQKAIDLLTKKKVECETYDVECPAGMAEAAFYDLISVPCILVVNDDDDIFYKHIGNPGSDEHIEKLVEYIMKEVKN